MIDDLPQLRAHSTAVAAIASRVRHFHTTKKPFRIYHGSTNSTRKSQYREDNIVDTSKMNHVLEVDYNKRLAFVEPNVPMDQLVTETRKVGLIPPVVMEFPGITAGGGFSGTSGESSSFRHGFFDRTVRFFEMVLANGEVVFASEKSNADLFYGAASSFGTLGVVTLLAIELVPAKSYVSLAYIKVRNMDDAIAKIRTEQKNSMLDYIDGMFFAKNHGVICLGSLTDRKPNEENIMRFTQAWDPWFYVNAEDKSRHRQSWNEIIPIEDYLFRYDRGAFWMGKYTFGYFAVPFNRFTRWALNRYTHTRVMYHALHQSGLSEKYIIQDVAIPYDRSTEFLSYVDTTFKHYPIWICPLRLHGKSGKTTAGIIARDHHSDGSLVTTTEKPEMMLNFGVWGPGPNKRSDFVSYNRAFEAKVQCLQGRKWLYAHTYYTEDEFWSIYDRKHYDELRQKYHATHLPSIYDKVRVDYSAEEAAIRESWWLWLCAVFWSIWPLSGLFGWWQCLVSVDYLLPRKSVGGILQDVLRGGELDSQDKGRRVKEC